MSFETPRREWTHVHERDSEAAQKGELLSDVVEPLVDGAVPDYSKIKLKPQTEAAAMHAAWDAVEAETALTDTKVPEPDTTAVVESKLEPVQLTPDMRVNEDADTTPHEILVTEPDPMAAEAEKLAAAWESAVATPEVAVEQSLPEETMSEVALSDESLVGESTPAIVEKARAFVSEEFDAKTGFTTTEQAAAHRLAELIEHAEDAAEQEEFFAQLQELPTFIAEAHDNTPEDFSRVANAELATIEIGHAPDDPEHANEFATAQVMYDQLQETLATFPQDTDPADQLLLEMAWQKRAKRQLENLMNLTERYHFSQDTSSLQAGEEEINDSEVVLKEPVVTPTVQPERRKGLLYSRYVWAPGETAPRRKRSFWQRVFGGGE